jgi:hypothetical protein
VDVSNIERSNLVTRDVVSQEVVSEDRLWLETRLQEYRELLTYLHDR